MELVKARIISFAYEAVSILVLGVLGFLSSPDFNTLVVKHFGETTTATVIVLVTVGIVKYIRNLKVLNDHDKVGAFKGEEPPLLI